MGAPAPDAATVGTVWKEHADVGALSLVMALWGLNLGFPLNQLQHIHWALLGHAIPLYYVFTVLLMAAAAALALGFKRDWSRWELLWWLLPLICVPGIMFSGDHTWSLRQCLSWVIRGVVPGGVIFIVACRKRSDALLLYGIYPVVIAAALLGLTELYLGRSPLGDASLYQIPATTNANPFYRSGVMSLSVAPRGTQGNRIPYAATLVGFLPVGLWLLKYRKGARWAHLVAVAILASILLLAQVRAVWLGALTSMLLMSVVGLLRNRRDAAKIIAGALLFFGIFILWPKTRDILWPRINSFHLAETSISARIDVLKTVVVLKDRWPAGVGFGQFPTACQPYYHSTWYWYGTADNQYFRWAVENGALSFALLLLFLVGLVRAGWKKVRAMEDVQTADFYKSLLVGWVSVAVTFIFFDGFYWGACNMTFWCLLGLFATCLSSPIDPI